MKAVILDHYGKKDGYGLAKCQTLSFDRVG